VIGAKETREADVQRGKAKLLEERCLASSVISSIDLVSAGEMTSKRQSHFGQRQT
jgi:hypothetical protein